MVFALLLITTLLQLQEAKELLSHQQRRIFVGERNYPSKLWRLDGEKLKPNRNIIIPTIARWCLDFSSEERKLVLWIKRAFTLQKFLGA